MDNVGSKTLFNPVFINLEQDDNFLLFVNSWVSYEAIGFGGEFIKYSALCLVAKTCNFIIICLL